MPFSRDIGRNLHAVCEPHASNLADSGVRLPRRLRGHLGANTALEWRGVEGRAIFKCIKTARQSRHARFARLILTASLRELVDGGHLEKEDPRGVIGNINE